MAKSNQVIATRTNMDRVILQIMQTLQNRDNLGETRRKENKVQLIILHNSTLQGITEYYQSVCLVPTSKFPQIPQIYQISRYGFET